MDLIKELQFKGFKLEVDNDRLLVTPKNKLTPELIELIKKNKQAIMTQLQQTDDGGYPASTYDIDTPIEPEY